MLRKYQLRNEKLGACFCVAVRFIKADVSPFQQILEEIILLNFPCISFSPSFPLIVPGRKATASSWNPLSASPMKPRCDAARSPDRRTDEKVSLLSWDKCWHCGLCGEPKGALEF